MELKMVVAILMFALWAESDSDRLQISIYLILWMYVYIKYLENAIGKKEKTITW